MADDNVIEDAFDDEDPSPADGWFDRSSVDWDRVGWQNNPDSAGHAWIAHFGEDRFQLDVTIVHDECDGTFGGRAHYSESSPRQGASVDVEIDPEFAETDPASAVEALLQAFGQVLANASKTAPAIDDVLPDDDAVSPDDIVMLEEAVEQASRGDDFEPYDDEGDDAQVYDLDDDAVEQKTVEGADEAGDGIEAPPDHPDPDHAFNDPNFSWSESQKRAIREAREFLADEDRNFFGIYGAAGTGKTAVIQYICDEFDGKVALTAPTHKATGVLSEMALGFGGADEITTIHSLLNMKKQREEGREYFAPEGGNVPDVPQDLLVVDECSMINEDLWGWIEQAQSQAIMGLKVICMGDPYQLPPVGEDMSPSFDVDGVELDEIVRHGGCIKETANEVRLNIGDGGPVVPEETEDADGAIVTYEGFDDWIDRAAECADTDEATSKIGAYTNDRVDDLNDEIRRRLIGEDAPAFVEGEDLVAVSTFTQKEMGQQGEDVVMYTEDRCTVLEAQSTTEKGQDCWWLRIEVHPHEDVHEVYAVTRDQSKDLDKRLSRLANQEKWGDFWPLKDAFVRLRPPYATTVHKCVHPDTWVETDDGMQRIVDIPDTGMIRTPSGDMAEYENKVANPPRRAVRITTEQGFELTVTPDHGLDVWRNGTYKKVLADGKYDRVESGDYIRFRLGPPDESRDPVPLHDAPDDLDVRAVEHDTPDTLTSDVAEFIGMMVADGTVYDEGFRLVKRHADTVNRFAELCNRLFGVEAYDVGQYRKNAESAEVSSVQLAEWVRGLDGVRPNDKGLPPEIMSSAPGVQRAFLRGLFIDAGVNLDERKGGDPVFDHIEFVQNHPTMIRDVQTLLMRLGIVAHRRDYDHRPETLYLYGAEAQKFIRDVGFVSEFKQSRAELCSGDPLVSHKVPVPSHRIDQLWDARPEVFPGKWVWSDTRQKGRMTRRTARKIADAARDEGEPIGWLEDALKFHHAKVDEIEEVTCPSVCVTVPDGHQFLQNRCAGWNCQGSSYDRVFLDQKNLFRSKHQGGAFRDRLSYVAYSRAAEELHIHDPKNYGKLW